MEWPAARSAGDRLQGFCKGAADRFALSKAGYHTGEQIKATVTIKNVTKQRLDNVRAGGASDNDTLEYDYREQWGALQDNGISLDAGATKTVTITGYQPHLRPLWAPALVCQRSARAMPGPRSRARQRRPRTHRLSRRRNRRPMSWPTPVSTSWV